MIFVRSVFFLIAFTAAPGLKAQMSASDRIADAAEVGSAVRAVGADSLTGHRLDFAEGVSVYPDLDYASLPGYRPLKLDLYLPPDERDFSGPRPLVVYVHGGGWAGGGPRRSAAYRDWPKVLGSLAAQGYVVAAVTYRFSSEEPFPAAIHDVKSAIRWLRINAATYGIDGGNVAIWGQSAGGHLAALAGTSCGVRNLEPAPDAFAQPVSSNVEVVTAVDSDISAISDCVQAVVGWFGVYDFGEQLSLTSSGSDGNTLPRQFLGCQATPCSVQTVAAASPVTHVDSDDPPFLLIHGDADTIVHVSQTENFQRALSEANVPVEKIIIPGVGHSWIGGSSADTVSASKQALRATVDFIERTIGKGKVINK